MHRLLVLAPLAGFLAGGPAAAVESVLKEVVLRKLAVTAPGTGFQAVRSDARGRAFVITDDLAVHELEGLASLRLVKTLRSDFPVAAPILPALSPEGGKWLVAAEGGKVVLFEGEKGTLLPPSPLPRHALGFWGSDPLVVAIVDKGLLRFLPEAERRQPAFLWRLDGVDWEPILRVGRQDIRTASTLELLSESGVLLAPDTRDRLWVASGYRYDVRKLSSTGREILRVQSERRSSAVEARGEKEQRLEARMNRAGVESERIAEVFVAPEAALRAITADTGDAYLLVAIGDEGGYCIDRIDGVSGQVQRAGIRAPSPEKLHSMAPTREGLVFASARSSDGLFFLAWSPLEAALQPLDDTEARVAKENLRD